jgi:hypothetical protein
MISANPNCQGVVIMPCASDTHELAHLYAVHAALGTTMLCTPSLRHVVRWSQAVHSWQERQPC